MAHGLPKPPVSNAAQVKKDGPKTSPILIKDKATVLPDKGKDKPRLTPEAEVVITEFCARRDPAL
jgi:hypothetical protein